MTTVAPGIAAPEASVIVPWIEPPFVETACPHAGLQQTSARLKHANNVETRNAERDLVCKGISGEVRRVLHVSGQRCKANNREGSCHQESLAPFSGKLNCYALVLHRGPRTMSGSWHIQNTFRAVGARHWPESHNPSLNALPRSRAIPLS